MTFCACKSAYGDVHWRSISSLGQRLRLHMLHGDCLCVTEGLVQPDRELRFLLVPLPSSPRRPPSSRLDPRSLGTSAVQSDPSRLAIKRTKIASHPPSAKTRICVSGNRRQQSLKAVINGGSRHRALTGDLMRLWSLIRAVKFTARCLKLFYATPIKLISQFAACVISKAALISIKCHFLKLILLLDTTTRRGSC